MDAENQQATNIIQPLLETGKDFDKVKCCASYTKFFFIIKERIESEPASLFVSQ